MPSVSVIIPNYNHARYLPQRIESILQQTFFDFECIILDDASTDNSKEIIEAYAAKDARISFYPSSVNSGSPFIQWNKGVRLAKNEFVWIAESDDSCSPILLESLLNCHLKNMDIGLAYCQSLAMDEKGNIHGSWENFTDEISEDFFKENFVMEGMEFINRFLIYRNVIPNSSAVLFKKSLFENAGCSDETLATNSDWFTWLKMLVNQKVAFIATPHNMFRHHAESVIAKLHSAKTPDYKEQYDRTMRLCFQAWCKRNNVKLKKRIQSVNRQLISYDTANRALHQYRNGKKIKGFLDIVKVSVFPRFTLGYLRRIVKMAGK